MEPIVLLSGYGHTVAFKITTARVCTLNYFITHWQRDRFPSQAWVTFLDSEDAKPRRLSASLIRKEFPQYRDTDFYRSIDY